MRNFLALAAVLALVPAASFGKTLTLNGKNQVNGQISYSSTTTGGASSSTLGLTPTFIHMFSDAFGFGAGVSYTSTTVGGATASGFGLVPTLQYHFLLTDSASYFVQVAYTTASATVGSVTASSSSFSAGLGMNYFFNDSVSFGPELTYTSVLTPATPTSSTISLVGAFTIWL